MKTKEVVDDITMNRAITRITYEIIERNKDLNQVVLAGIKTRGVHLAHRIQKRLAQLEQIDIPVAEIDTKPFRDDKKSQEEDTTLIPVDITDRQVILIDDVLYTGRTIRAAIDNLVSHGRPSRVSLAVLVDRGRELPIRTDYIGKNIPTSRTEEIIVEMAETDGQDRILIKGE